METERPIEEALRPEELNDLPLQLSRLSSHLQNKYLLTLIIAERAKQIVLDPDRAARGDETNPVTLALKDLAEGRLQPQIQLTDERMVKALQGQPEDIEIFPYRP